MDHNFSFGQLFYSLFFPALSSISLSLPPPLLFPFVFFETVSHVQLDELLSSGDHPASASPNRD